MKRFGYSIFCDDIRNEVGGKLSFIGCYNAVMFVPPQLPVVLPKFCVHAHIVSPAAMPYRSIVIRCYGAGDSAIIAEEPIAAPEAEEQMKLVAELKETNAAPRYIVASASLLFAPLEINGPGLISVRALVDDDPEEVPLGSLRVVLQD